MSTNLESPKQLAARIGWPERRIRKLVNAKRIRHLRVGSSIFFPPNAAEDFIKENMVEPCPQDPKDRDLSPARAKKTNTSGTRTPRRENHATKQQALRTANKLRKNWKTSSGNNEASD